MQPIARSLALTAILFVVALAGLLLAAPMQKDAAPPPADSPRPQPALKTVTPAPPPVAPITFADPDGQELILEELSARTAIHGMLSLTELELRFRNPQARRIEGRFTCVLPPNAAISRFAKDVNGQLMEGEVVERLRANQVYEQFLHQMRDPALLEQDQGNRFSARIFPIEANAPVRILLSYTTLLPMRDNVRTYALPLRGLPKVNKFTFRAFVTPVPGEGETGKLTTSTAQVTSFEERDWTPDRDMVLTWRADASTPRGRILRAGDFYLASYRLGESAVSAKTTRPSGWIFYADTSASSAEGAPHRIRALEEVIGALPPNDPVQVLAFDQEIAPLASGSAAQVSRTIGEKLRARLFLGGTDVSAMLRDVASRVKNDRTRTVVLASDLVPTLGAAASHEVKNAMAAIPPETTIHALILGSREDAPTARAVTQGRGRIVRIGFTESLAARAQAAAEELRRPLGATLEIGDAAAEWIYPTRFEDVQPGDEVLALAKLRPAVEPAPLFGGAVSGRLNDAASTRLNASTFAPLLEREAYRAHLDYLAEREAGEATDAVRRALAAEQVRISVEQRVVIPRTTMLVLESEWDYQRFGLDRRALAAILTIDAGGIGRIDRERARQEVATLPLPPPQPVPVPRRDEDIARKRTQPPARAPQPGTVAETITITAEAPMVDTGNAASGAVMYRFAANEEIAGAEGIESAADDDAVSSQAASPRIMPPPPPPPPPSPSVTPAPERERKVSTPDWTKRARPPRSRIQEIEAQLDANPKDRELYNQLGELLAAWSEWSSLRRLALRWQPYDPENPQVYELLGLADQHLGNDGEAARAYASLIEIAPAKTELLQRAGLLLLGIGRARIAETPLRRALEARPDRVNGYRHLALMLWSEGRHEEAARVLESATKQAFPNWYLDVQRIVREELGYIYRGWLAKEPSRRAEIADRAREYAVDLERRDALRVTLAWETDANDVDLHVVDPAGEEAFYSHKRTASGLELYADVTQGLGPEVIRAEKLQRGTYHVGVRYFAAGPMGISRGVVIVMRGDAIEVHPFRLAKGGEEIRYVAAVDWKG